MKIKIINPNPLNVTTEAILKLLIEANNAKAEQAILAYTSNVPTEIAG